MVTLPMAAIIPFMVLVSVDAIPRAQDANIACSRSRQPSAYAHAFSPTECPMIPFGSIPKTFKISTKPI